MTDKSKVFSRKVYKPGERIMTEGEEATGAFLIQQGKVEIFVMRGNEKVLLAHAGKEEVIGEMALIDKAPRSANINAVEPTVTLFVDRATFDAKLQTADPFVRALVRMLASRIRRMIDSLQSGS